MAENWAILASSFLIIVALAMLVFYLIPLQTRLLIGNNDALNGLRRRLLASVVFIVIAASPVLTNRLYRWLGLESVLLANVSILSIGIAFLAFSVGMVSVYKYKKKE